MADYDEDVNSSDMEFSEPQDTQPRSVPGARAMGSIAAQSVADRFASKKALKTLTHVANSPATEYIRQYWLNLFTEFAAGALNINKRVE
jgi:hypothetical protein